MHYERWRKHGDPLWVAGAYAMRSAEPASRIWPKIKRDPSGCWLWTAGCDPKGYGTISVDGLTRRAHRYVYEVLVEPVDPELDLDHLCRVRACVNPSHLEPVTSVENTRRGEGHGSEAHCPQGHSYEGENRPRVHRRRRQHPPLLPSLRHRTSTALASRTPRILSLWGRP